MRASSRLALSTVIACGIAFAAGGSTLAQDDDDGIIGDVACNSVEALADPLVGCVDEDDETPPSDGDEGTPPAGAQDDDEADDSSNDMVSDIITPQDTDDSDDARSSGSDSDTADRDNGVAPQGGIETGAGGTADSSDAVPVSLAGGIIIAAGGAMLARRQYARRSRHAR